MPSSRSSSPQQGGGSALSRTDTAAVAPAPDRSASDQESCETPRDIRSAPTASREVSSSASSDTEAQLTVPLPETADMLAPLASSSVEVTAARDPEADSAPPLPTLQLLPALRTTNVPSTSAPTAVAAHIDAASSTRSPEVHSAASFSSARASAGDATAAEASPVLSQPPSVSVSPAAASAVPPALPVTTASVLGSNADPSDGVITAPPSATSSTPLAPSSPSNAPRPAAVHLPQQQQQQEESVRSTDLASAEQRGPDQTAACEEDAATPEVAGEPLPQLPGRGADTLIDGVPCATEMTGAAKASHTTVAEEDGTPAPEGALPVPTLRAGASALPAGAVDKSDDEEGVERDTHAEETTVHESSTMEVASAPPPGRTGAAEVQAEVGDTSTSPDSPAVSTASVPAPSRKRRRAPLAGSSQSSRRATTARLDTPGGDLANTEARGEEKEEEEAGDGGGDDTAASPTPVLAAEALDRGRIDAGAPPSPAVERVARSNVRHGATAAEETASLTHLGQPAPDLAAESQTVQRAEEVAPREDEKKQPTRDPCNAAEGKAADADATDSGAVLPHESSGAVSSPPSAGGLGAPVHAAAAAASAPSAVMSAAQLCSPRSSPNTSSAPAPPVAVAASALPEPSAATSASGKSKSNRRTQAAATAANAAAGAPSGSAAGRDSAPSPKPVLNLAGVNVQALLAESADPPPVYTRRQRRTRRKAALAEDHRLFAEHRDLWEHDLTGRTFPRAPFATDADVLGSLTEWTDSPALVYAQLLWRYAPGPFVRLAMRDLDSTPYAKAEGPPLKAETCLKREKDE